MLSAGGNITTITINRHEIPNIQIKCVGLKMLHSRVELWHHFVSAREYAFKVLTSRDIRERLNISPLESCVED